MAASEKKRTGTAKGNKKPAGQKLAGMKKPPGGGLGTVRNRRAFVEVPKSKAPEAFANGARSVATIDCNLGFVEAIPLKGGT